MKITKAQAGSAIKLLEGALVRRTYGTTSAARSRLLVRMLHAFIDHATLNVYDLDTIAIDLISRGLQYIEPLDAPSRNIDYVVGSHICFNRHGQC